MSDTKAPVGEPPVAFLLLTLPDVVVKQVYDGEEMPLAHDTLLVDCVSLPIPPEIGHQTANPFAPTGEETHDLWLVLKVGDFEHTLIPGNHLGVRAPPGGDGGPQYISTTPEIPNGQVTIQLEAPRNSAEYDDLVSFESLLTQYGALNPTETAMTGIIAPVLIHPPTEDSIAAVDTNEKNKVPATYNEEMLAPPVVAGGADLRGRIVLVDEKTGSVLGELEQQPVGTEGEAAALASSDPTRPVVVDFGAPVDSYVGRDVRVTLVPQDELDDWIFRGADKISRSILAFGSWGSQQMIAGAEKFKKHTVPCPEPIKIGSKTSSGLRTAHMVSFKGAHVSQKTVNTINGYIGRVTGGKAPKIPNPPTPPPASPAPGSSKKGYTAMFKEGAEKLKAAAGYGSGRTSPGAGAAATPAGTVPPPLPPRKATPPIGSAEPPPYTKEKSDTLYPTDKPAASTTQQAADIKAPTPVQIPPQAASPGPSTPAGARKKRPLLNRSVIALDAVLSAAEVAANNLISAGTAAASSAVAHKYGNEAGQATAMAGSTVRNVVLVYVDARGVARRGLLKATAKGYIKAKLRSGETVRIQPQTAGAAATGPSVVDHQLVVGVPQVPQKK